MAGKKSLVGCLFLGFWLAAGSRAQTVPLQAVADTFLRQSAGNQSHGVDPVLQLSATHRALVRFDSAAVASAVGSGRLVSASLELFVRSAGGWGPDGRPLEVRRLTAAWTEAGATWNCAADTQPTNSRADCAVQWDGGSLAEDSSDTILQTAAGGVWIQLDVTADVAAFLAGTPNHGWLIKKADEEQAGNVDYASREGAAAERPRLVLLVESALHDQVPPSLAITSPSQPILVNEPSPALTMEYTDGGSGVDTGAFHALLDDLDITASCTVGERSATCRPPALAAGTHRLQARLRDRAGNAAQAAVSFQLLLGPGPHLVTFQATGDTYLRTGGADRNQGDEPILRVREQGQSRSLIQFDTQSLLTTLSGATLVSATLELHVQSNGHNWGRSGRTVDAHRVTVPWTEMGATWSCPVDANPTNQRADCAVPWNGGSFAPVPTASVLHPRDLTGWVKFDVTADVAGFVAGAPNKGWLIKKTNERQSGRVDYDSRQGAAGQGPKLVLVFQTTVGTDTAPPTVAMTSPQDRALLSSSPVMVTGTASDDVAIASVTVNGQSAAVANGSFQASVNLAEGVSPITVVATDTSGKQSFASRTLTLDTTQPVLTVDSPAPGQLTNQSTIEVTGSADDLNGIAAVEVNGVPVPLTEGRFTAAVVLGEGGNTVTIAATDAAGNRSQTAVALTRFSLPEVTITSPADLSYLAATTVDVSGTVSGPVSYLYLNGVSAAVSGTTFIARDVPLIEGGNILTAAATDDHGHIGTASINVVRDLTPPRVAIDDPAEDTHLLDATVTVSGLVNDIVDGTVNAAEAAVTVNGRPAIVSNRSFTVDVPLLQGANVLTAVAVDRSGNTGQASVTVHRDPPGASRIAAVSGDHQEAVIGSLLPNLLTAILLDAAGQPVPGKPVLFAVRGNDGSLDGGKRQIAVLTDASGHASAHFTLGTRVGAGNQRVEAAAVGFRGPVLFRASALPGSPTAIVVDSGNQQYGIAGQALPRPLVAVVTDVGYNRLAGVPVRFKVVKGRGHFLDGSPDLIVTSDSDGRAIVPWVLDPEEGIANNVVQARIDALPDGPQAGFVATGRVAGDPLMTTVSGVVLDNSNQPVPGVTLRILDTAFTAQTDSQGLFRIAGAPVGTVKLIVDGSTSQRSGAWPDLEFVLTTIPGRDNTLGMPIYLLPLDLSKGILIDETHGGTLTLADVPGFALEILAGSVTFPGGSKSGVVSVTVVHNDKVPMVPNFGQQPLLIVTIQPAGARFEPPARLTVPNIEGFPPGQVAELYSFDHDLGHFVSIGPGTVSEDGIVITSNHGVGIVKAGWHCSGFPQDIGAPNDCPECTKCLGADCAMTKLCEHCGLSPSIATACDGKGHCKTGRGLIPQICDQLSLATTNHRKFQCPDVPPPLGGEGSCGAVLLVDYTKVIHSCGLVDLEGAEVTETLIANHECSPPNFDPDRGGKFTVRQGNDVSGNSDEYSLCVLASALPTPYHCTESYTQENVIDGCSRKVTIIFEIIKTETDCTAIPERQ